MKKYPIDVLTTDLQKDLNALYETQNTEYPILIKTYVEKDEAYLEYMQEDIGLDCVYCLHNLSRAKNSIQAGICFFKEMEKAEQRVQSCLNTCMKDVKIKTMILRNMHTMNKAFEQRAWKTLYKVSSQLHEDLKKPKEKKKKTYCTRRSYEMFKARKV